MFLNRFLTTFQFRPFLRSCFISVFFLLAACISLTVLTPSLVVAKEVEGVEKITTLDYETRSVSGAYPFSVQIRPDHSGYHIVETSELHEQEFFCGPDFEVYKWQFSNSSLRINLVGIKKKDHIQITGRFHGNRINRSIPTEGYPWYQNIRYAFSHLIQTETKELRFIQLKPNATALIKTKLTQRSKKGDNYFFKSQHLGVFGIFTRYYYWVDTDGILLKEVIKTNPRVETVLVRKDG